MASGLPIPAVIPDAIIGSSSLARKGNAAAGGEAVIEGKAEIITPNLMTLTSAATDRHNFGMRLMHNASYASVVLS